MASLPPQNSADTSNEAAALQPEATEDAHQIQSDRRDASTEGLSVSPTPRPLSRTDAPADSPPVHDQAQPPSPSGSSQQPTSPVSPSHSQHPPAWQAADTTDLRPSLTRSSTSSEPKKCWICFGDSTEDTPETSSWRTPCPCALTAHESCLLDWIADLEAPTGSTSQSSRRRKSKIQCPQCKTTISVARPWSPVVATVKAVERITGTLVLPGVAGVLFGGVFSACFVHGAVSVLLVLGPEDWARLIGAGADGRPTKVGFRFTVGLSMLPMVLVLSRTTLADGLLPMLSLVFFAPQLAGRRNVQRFISGSGQGSSIGYGYETAHLWPPSMAMAFASLPYIRAFYNAAYARLFAARQREWLKAVQREPRPGEEDVQEEQNMFRAEGGNNGDLEIELNAQIQVMDDDHDDEDRDPEAVQRAIDDAVRAAEERQRNQAQDGAAGQNANNAQPRPQNNGLILSASKIADTVLGALCFPAIAAVMGEALKVGLPAKWTTAATLSRRPGLLQSKWGRSIVGGCFFVVMKDVLLLYSHYRLAQDHRKRRVLDYNGPAVRSRSRTRRS